MTRSYPYHHIPRCQHIKTNGVQCGSPALRRKRRFYFHERWRATRLDLNQAGALRLTTTVELPVLEDADSIQVALTQVLRLLLCRQVDAQLGGRLLYGLQIASSNLRQMTLDPDNKQDIVIDPASVGNNGVGDEAWSTADFHGQNLEEPEPEPDPEPEHPEPTHPSSGDCTENLDANPFETTSSTHLEDPIAPLWSAAPRSPELASHPEADPPLAITPGRDSQINNVAQAAERRSP